MIRFQMADILPLIGVPSPPPGRVSFNIPCPCCDEDPRKKHLNIHLQKNVFRCPRCGFSGGVFDLYAHYAGIPRESVLDTLLARLDVPCPRQEVATAAAPAVEECPLIDPEARHATYTALLDRLSLASDHLENLRGRGFSDDEIQVRAYKTTPVVGMTTMAKQLQADGFYLSGVPGFYRKDGQWTLVGESRGILIPVRDLQGRIQGLQIRRDRVTRRKFRWLSSVGKPDGCKAESWAHMAGTPCKTVLLTEGPLKADVIHTLTGMTVVAVAGVNALIHLRTVLEQLRDCGVQQIMTAFDMDFLSNPHVENGYRNLTQLLEESGFTYGTYLWDPAYKGLDDYIWQFCMKCKRA